MENLQQLLADLQSRILLLEQENKMLRSAQTNESMLAAHVPPTLEPLFEIAQEHVRNYFDSLKMEPAKGTIEIKDERYVLVRASAFSKSFLETIRHLYADKGEKEAFAIGKNFLFDYAHVIGRDDARNFHRKMQLTEPVARLSAGPIHFAFSGWAFVEIDAASNVTSDEDFCIIFKHPYSFEADSWIREGKTSEEPVCIMNAGYASGWCEESFHLELTTVEVKCIAKGDDCCQFIMAPPAKIQDHLSKLHQADSGDPVSAAGYTIPTLFERKRVEEELERSRKLAEESAQAKADFVANISHELRTPLGSILGFADLLKKTSLDDQQRDYLQAIVSSGKNLLGIINNVLDLTRLDARAFPVECEAFDIRQTIESVRTMLLPHALAKQLAFNSSIDDAINFYAEGDQLRLIQILTNLAGNAIKFTNQGEVTISCSLLEDDAEHVLLKFTVADTGIGIPADKMEKIFERFSQADTKVTRRYGGTGLGLAITREMIALLNGSISVTSSDRGSVFECSLPYRKIARVASLPEEAAKEQQLPATGITGTVLIVDDQLLNRKLAAIVLEQHGFETASVPNGAEAIVLLKDRKFDLILMDLQMPDLDGYETVRIIRNELRLSTPVIAITAHALQGEKEQCLRAGMNDHLAKPYAEAALIKKVRQLISQDSSVSKIPATVDSSYLLQQTGNSVLVEEMTRIFLEQLPGELDRLQEAIIQKNFREIFSAAHMLRNSTALFGMAKNVGMELLQIEQIARNEDGLDEIRLLFYEVDRVCRDVCHAKNVKST